MIELMEKAILAGIGTLALSQKKAEELIEEVKKQFNLSEEKGKELLGKVQEAARDNQKKLEEMARQEIKEASLRFGLVPREEFEQLAQRVRILEERLRGPEEPAGP